MHSGYGIHEEMDQRADQALMEIGLDPEEAVGRILLDFFAWAATTTMSCYHDSADDVPPALVMPKWSWNGLRA